MTLSEYFLRLEAYQIKKVDMQENMAMQAWQNQAVQATTGSSKHPRPKYKNFEDFFNTIAAENKVHRYFNQDYVAPVESEQERQLSEQELIFKRYEKLQKIREKQRKNKKGG